MATNSETMIGHFVDNSDGTVTDTHAGLMWQRCALGQTWDGNTCTGSAKGFVWSDAINQGGEYAGYDDWRLPSIDELKGLAKAIQTTPLTYASAFPCTPSAYFWSNTPGTISNEAWGINFSNGDSIAGAHGFNNHVRLIRGNANTASSKNTEVSILVHSYDIGVAFEVVENAEMRSNDDAVIFYLSVFNNKNKQVRVTLPFSTYVTARNEEIEQDVWLSGLIVGTNGTTIRSGAHKKVGLVYLRSKLPEITVGDKLYVTVELPKASQQYTFTFRCADQATRLFILVDAETRPSNENEAQNAITSTEVDISSNIAEILKRLYSIESRLETSLSRTDAVIGALSTGISKVQDTLNLLMLHASGQPKTLETITHLQQYSAVSADKFTTGIAELQQVIVSAPQPVSIQSHANSEPEVPTLYSLETVSAWLLEQDAIPISELRIRLLPLDLLPSGVINDINERALDLTGELALVEEGDIVIVQREVLLQVIAG